jgi:hypothetical protein
MGMDTPAASTAALLCWARATRQDGTLVTDLMDAAKMTRQAVRAALADERTPCNPLAAAAYLDCLRRRYCAAHGIAAMSAP